jgi:hypothetical protein
MDDLFLLAVAAGNGRSDIRLFQLCLAHDRPPNEMLEVGRFSVNRKAVKLTVEIPPEIRRLSPGELRPNI